MKYIRYLGFTLAILSITVGFMIDCNSFDKIESLVSFTFFGFILGVGCLCYVDDKLKSK